MTRKEKRIKGIKKKNKKKEKEDADIPGTDLEIKEYIIILVKIKELKSHWRK